MGQSGIIDNIDSFNGPGARAAKYDVLTALLVMASQGEAVEARLALRLSLLITARFNWRKGVFAVGQKELARIWGVTERTVKREMGELRTRGWIEVAVPSARGRVAVHRINFETMLRETMRYWTAVGPDFVERLTGAPEPEGQGSNVVPLRRETPSLPESGLWNRIADHLCSKNPAVYNAWFSQLVYVDVEQGVLKLMAPTLFFANYINSHYQGHLMAAALAQDCSVREVKVVTSEKRH